MFGQLLHIGIEENIYVYSGNCNVERVTRDNYELLNCKKRIPNGVLWFDYHIVEHCNLNCAGCLHFSSIAKEEYADAQVYRKNLIRIKSIIGERAVNVILLGGEPLLHPRLTSFFNITKEVMPWMGIVLVTNGALIDKMDDLFWSGVQDNEVVISVTQYPISVDYDKVFQLLEDKQVDYEINMGKGEQWSKLNLDNSRNGDCLQSFCDCSMANKCITLTKEGKLFTCPVPAHFHHFKSTFNTEMDICKDDYIDIYDDIDSFEVMQKLATPIPFCRYCGKRTLSNWSVTRKAESEWLQQDSVIVMQRSQLQ